MRRIVLMAGMAAMLFAFHGQARAVSFTLDGYDVSLNDQDPGLVLRWTPVLEQPYTYDLELGGSIQVRLFQIGTDESYVNLDDIFWKEIDVTFDFSNPDVIHRVEGETRGRWLLQDGVVRWQGPVFFSFAETGLFSVALTDARFDLGRTADIWATFSLEREGETGPAPVPEPATAFLLGSGLIGLGWSLRKGKASRKKA